MGMCRGPALFVFQITPKTWKLVHGRETVPPAGPLAHSQGITPVLLEAIQGLKHKGADALLRPGQALSFDRIHGALCSRICYAELCGHLDDRWHLGAGRVLALSDPAQDLIPDLWPCCPRPVQLHDQSIGVLTYTTHPEYPPVYRGTPEQQR